MAAIDLLARAICPPGTYYRNGACYRKSGWYYWGRWVLAAVVIFVTILALFLICCVRSRRQRRQGLRPMYGTGWMAPNSKFGPHQQGQQQWAGGQHPPPPPYGSQNQYPPGFGTGYGPPAPPRDYYGQADGVQQPQNAYQPVYSPPAGPPPGK